MNNDLFFSVCTEVTNRSSTIINTIKGIEKQTFTNYEYIIYENCSDDNSLEVIKSYINQCSIKEKIKLIPGQNRKSDIESWNMPLKHAEGLYIAVCEGDDMFAEDHLDNLHNILSHNCSIGILVSLRIDDTGYFKYSNLGYDQVLKPKQMKKHLINFEFCPPPSEACFLRENPTTKESYFYDEENLVYAAEFSIYENIIDSNLDCYISSKRSIERGLSIYRKGYLHIKDPYFLREKWKPLYDDNQILEVSEKLFKLSFRMFLSQIPSTKLERRLLKHLKEEFMNVRKLRMTLYCLIQIFIFIYHSFRSTISRIIRSQKIKFKQITNTR